MKMDLASLMPNEIMDLLKEMGEKPYRAEQLFSSIHKNGISNLLDISTLSLELRRKLEEKAPLHFPKVKSKKISADGTRKYLLETHDGRSIESVFIPNASAQGRNALCISSQVGCAMGCRFCATAALKLTRNLTPSEIVGQVYAVINDLAADLGEAAAGADFRPIDNIVYMGMGEPLHNYDHVIRSIALLTHEKGRMLAPRRITVSTSGIAPRIGDLGKDTKVHIAISLNATTNATRTEIMPVNKKWDIEKLLDTCRAFPLPRRRRITFEYVLLKGINDSLDDAKRLTRLLKGMPSKINLIPFNEHPLSPYKKPAIETTLAFQDILINSGFSAFIRSTRGDDIDAACGMLGAAKLASAREKQKAELNVL
jgi:23S rRNA (adenine2503-C2)-methyltransferase